MKTFTAATALVILAATIATSAPTKREADPKVVSASTLDQLKLAFSGAGVLGDIAILGDDLFGSDAPAASATSTPTKRSPEALPKGLSPSALEKLKTAFSGAGAIGDIAILGDDLFGSDAPAASATNSPTKRSPEALPKGLSPSALEKLKTVFSGAGAIGDIAILGDDIFGSDAPAASATSTPTKRSEEVPVSGLKFGIDAADAAAEIGILADKLFGNSPSPSPSSAPTKRAPKGISLSTADKIIGAIGTTAGVAGFVEPFAKPIEADLGIDKRAPRGISLSTADKIIGAIGTTAGVAGFVEPIAADLGINV